MHAASDSRTDHPAPEANTGQNPFIGARPFLSPPAGGQYYCRRDAACQSVQALLNAGRVVILHGGAGVGKTSFLHAELAPDLASRGLNVLAAPAGRSGAEFQAWCARQKAAPPAAPLILVCDPADGIAANRTALDACLDLLDAAPEMRILFCLRPAAALRLATALEHAGRAAALYQLDALSIGQIESPPASAADITAASTNGHVRAARFAAVLWQPAVAPNRAVEPVLLQVAGHALWPTVDDAPDVLAPRVDAALAEHCAAAVAAALAHHPGLVSAPELAAWMMRHLALDGAAPTLVLRGATASAGMPNAILDALEEGWLLRTYARGGSSWVGLLDQRLAVPLQQAFARRTPVPLRAADGNTQRTSLNGEGVQSSAAAPPVELAQNASPQSQPPDAGAAARKRKQILRVAGATTAVAGMLLLVVWALATARTAQRELQNQLAVQAAARAASAAQIQQLGEALATAQAESAAAVAQRQRNDQLGRALRAGQLAGAAILRREDAPTQALLYAVEALRVQQQSGEPPVAEAVQGLRDLLTTLGGQPFTVGADDVSTLALSDDALFVAAGDAAGGLHLWRTDSGAGEQVIAAHDGPIWGLGWLTDQRLVSAGADGMVALWAIGDDGARLTRTAHTALSEAEIYALDVALDRDLVALGDAAGGVHLWQPNEPASSATPARHAGAVNVVRFSPDGSAVASGSDDGQVLLTRLDGAAAQAIVRHEAAVNALAFSPDGQRLASAGFDGSLALVDAVSGSVVMLADHGSPVNAVAFSADGRWLASGDDNGLVRVWSTADPTSATLLRGHRNSVRDLAFVPTAEGSRLLTISYDRTARLWDYLRPEANPVVLRGHDDQLTRLAAAGSRFATAAYDHTIRLWNANQPFAQPDLTVDARQPQGEIALAAGSEYLVASSLTRPYVEVWDPATGLALYRREGHSGALAALAVSPDGAAFFTGGRDGRIRIWYTSGTAPGPAGPTLNGHQGPVNSLAVHPAGTLLASGGDDTTVRVWDLPGGEPRLLLPEHAAAVMGLAFNRDGGLLASVDRTGLLLVHDVATGALLHRLGSDGAGFLAVAFRPDGRWVAAAAEDGAIWIWDLAALALGPTTLHRHSTEVNALAFAPGSDLLASVDADGLLYLWDLTRLSSAPLAVRAHPASANAVAFADDGAALYTAGADGTLRRWTVRHDDLIAIACASAGRNLTPAEWDQVFDTAPYRSTCPELEAN